MVEALPGCVGIWYITLLVAQVFLLNMEFKFSVVVL